MPYTPPANPSAQLSVVLKYVDAFSKLDAAGIIALLDDSYQHYYFPKSMGWPVSDKAEWGARITSALLAFERFDLDILDVTEGDNKVILHIAVDGRTKFGLPNTNEYMFTYFFTEDATEPKIKIINEFMDSAYAAKFFKEMAEQQAKEAAKQPANAQ
ncbi:hypothetical protein SISNIDRAFT_32626 [Sistotremastrum niveocremeum HHB9708]|uniref:SnoaL-like domain-containing protein n=2 Tax=Sistotremastraceae TaxID=3402574 RepID=A0A164W7W3_9AGAM|nr:hypothetical protein SISNIDRAFT_32626 [Sistotremastrum niveocremeum HHB9708]KZT41664.1 hypothetical protein SISSUDRAFT_1059193 [Sistotremastrum suecicum HHB10207 ss-3]